MVKDAQCDMQGSLGSEQSRLAEELLTSIAPGLGPTLSVAPALQTSHVSLHCNNGPILACKPGSPIICCFLTAHWQIHFWAAMSASADTAAHCKSTSGQEVCMESP